MNNSEKPQFPNPSNDNEPSELMDSVRKLGKTLEEKGWEQETDRKHFETETGFAASVFYNGDKDATHLYLTDKNLNAVFQVIPDDKVYMEYLRGPDGEHITDDFLVSKFKTEAERLLRLGKLVNKNKNPEEQLNLPI